MKRRNSVDYSIYSKYSYTRLPSFITVKEGIPLSPKNSSQFRILILQLFGIICENCSHTADRCALNFRWFTLMMWPSVNSLCAHNYTLAGHCSKAHDWQKKRSSFMHTHGYCSLANCNAALWIYYYFRGFLLFLKCPYVWDADCSKYEAVKMLLESLCVALHICP